ncbi:MAG: hypothetical protein EKK32_29270, partial [Bradyrhizobiaceae bacterium]
ATAKPAERTADSKTAEAKPTEGKPAPKPVAAKPAETKQAAARPPYKPAANETPTTTGSASAQTQTALVSGAAPVLQSNSFDSRFAGFK